MSDHIQFCPLDSVKNMFPSLTYAEPLPIRENVFLSGIKQDLQGRRYAMQEYHDFKRNILAYKIADAKNDLDRIKRQDPWRMNARREDFIREWAADLGDAEEARALADKVIPIAEQYILPGDGIVIETPNPSSTSKVPKVFTKKVRDIELSILEREAKAGNPNSQAKVLAAKVIKMPEKMPEIPMHIVTPKPNPGILKTPITKQSLATAAAKTQEAGFQGIVNQTKVDQLSINTSNAIGKALGSAAVKLAQGKLDGEALGELTLGAVQSVATDIGLNAAGDAVRGGLEQFIPADKIPGIGHVMRAATIGEAILKAPNAEQALKKGADAATNCAIQYTAGTLAPTIVTIILSSPVTLPAAGTAATVAATAFVATAIGSAGIALKDAIVKGLLS
jgi:hypothetical protein